MIVLACGSRSWTDVQIIRQRITQLDRKDLLIHGDAIGADAIVHACAKMHNLFIGRFTVEQEHYDVYGKRAPIFRNLAMASLIPHLCIAFRSEGKSRGTDMMVETMLKMRLSTGKRIDVEVWYPDGRKIDA